MNVLKGEMSLVGPRPCLAYEAAKYQPWQMERFNAVPGLDRVVAGQWQEPDDLYPDDAVGH